MRETRPARALVQRLLRRWNAEEASVLADWCEERELDGSASALREALTDVASRHEHTCGQHLKTIVAIATVLGVRPDQRALNVTLLDWARSDYKKRIRRQKLCGFEWRGGSLSHRPSTPARWAAFAPVRRCTRPADHAGDHQHDVSFAAPRAKKQGDRA